jgi:hypothetical protein
MKADAIYLYRITNTLNGKVYIGQTRDPIHRWRIHLRAKDARRISSSCLHASIRKHGGNSFTFEVLEVHEGLEKANEAEIRLIAQHGSTDRTKGYNLTVGGSEKYPRKKPVNVLFTYYEAQAWCVENSVDSYKAYMAARRREPRLPGHPQGYYKDTWRSMAYFLGVGPTTGRGRPLGSLNRRKVDQMVEVGSPVPLNVILSRQTRVLFKGSTLTPEPPP